MAGPRLRQLPTGVRSKAHCPLPQSRGCRSSAAHGLDFPLAENGHEPDIGRAEIRLAPNYTQEPVQELSCSRRLDRHALAATIGSLPAPQDRMPVRGSEDVPRRIDAVS